MNDAIPKKQLGQHWLHDESILNSICDSANITKEDYVVEVGPGLGTLTQKILDRGAHVHAIEFDQDLAMNLRQRVKAQEGQLEISEADIMRFDFTELPKDYKIVANIPYYLTSGLLRLLSETANPPSCASLLVQKEVAERVCALPGQTSLLSISTQMYFETSLGTIVPAALFTPPPKVDSQVLILKRRSIPYFHDLDQRKLFQVVKAGFSERRKKIRSSLSGGLRIEKNEADELLAAAKISGEIRAQNLTLDDWVRLASSWNPR
jgi:16S rRNA (adenine1518-N6/adenine1519-N6)-dimethyltransferase